MDRMCGIHEVHKLDVMCNSCSAIKNHVCYFKSHRMRLIYVEICRRPIRKLKEIQSRYGISEEVTMYRTQEEQRIQGLDVPKDRKDQKDPRHLENHRTQGT